MGRNPKPIQLHLLEGNKNRLTKSEIDKRKKAEDSLTFGTDKIKPPTWLNDEAKKIFRKLSKEFEAVDLLVNVDVYALSLFCDAYTTYIECSRIIEQDGVTIEGSRSAEAGVVAHPLMAKKVQLATQMDKQMSKFGLSPVDRLKLISNLNDQDEQEKSPEEKLFGDV